MTIFYKFQKYGIAGSAQKAISLLKQKSGWYDLMYRKIPKYQEPTFSELLQIESDLQKLDITVNNYSPSPKEFKAFVSQNYFPENYHGGKKGNVWDEKLLEHYISFEKLGLAGYLPEEIYVDVAAAGSPWAKILRENFRISAYAIDLEDAGIAYKNLPYYRVENATITNFESHSVKGISLHCAYEMFMGDDDIDLIKELSRILALGGKAIILPLYMHTHYCSYSSPEYFTKEFSDSSMKKYVRMNTSGIPSSRKYDALTLKKRILNEIESLGMRYHISVLRNKKELGNNIYCHFILEIER